MNRAIIMLFILLGLMINIDKGYCDFKPLTKLPTTLRVGVVQDDLFPFIYVDSQGFYRGFEFDIVRDLGSVLGLEQIDVKPFKNKKALLKGLLNNQVDCAASKITKNLSDGEFIAYSNSYMELKSVFLINRKLQAQLHLQTETPQNFSESVSIGTLDGDNFYERLQKAYPKNQIVKVADFAQLIDQVIRGQLVACIIDEARAKLYFSKHSDNALLLAYISWVEWSDDVSLAFSWKNKRLRDLSNILLQSRESTVPTLENLFITYSNLETR